MNTRTTHRFLIGERLWEVSSEALCFTRKDAKKALTDYFAGVSETTATITDITNLHRIECESVLLRTANDLGCRSTERTEGKLFMRFPYATVSAKWNPHELRWTFEHYGVTYSVQPQAVCVRQTLLTIIERACVPPFPNKPDDWKIALAVLVFSAIVLAVTAIIVAYY